MTMTREDDPVRGEESPVQPSIVIPRRTLVALLVALLLLVAAASVAVTLWLTQRTNSADSSVAALPPTTPITQTPSAVEAPYGPTPTAETPWGSWAPALLAASQTCDPLGLTEGEVNFMATIEIDEVASVLTVDGVSDDDIAFNISNGFGTEGQVLRVQECVLEVLDAPSGVLERMGNTRALDGTQSESWDKFKLTWTYHPESGLDSVFSYAGLAE